MRKFKLRNSLAIAVYTVLVAGVLISCTTDSSRVSKDIIETKLGFGIEIITVDSCEYVWVKRGYGGGLSHKGNCKNVQHACN